MKITFVGHGYVGLVTASIFADLGNTVYVIGHTHEKVENLKKGILPIYEPGLEEIVKRNVDAGRLLFTLDYNPAIAESEIVFIAVGTPPKPTGEADLSVVFDVAEKIAQSLDGYTVVATKSTVPVGTNKKVKEILGKYKTNEKAEFDVASCPEFLREGSAIGDTLRPDRVVVGTESERAQEKLIEIHRGIEAPLVLTNLETAEMIKYAANSFLATKISFANAIAQLSELAHADAVKVLEGIGLDERIGKRFLNPGAGYGGSCFPKDVKALIAISRDLGYDFKLLEEVESINYKARMEIVRKTEKLAGDVAGKTIAVLGLAFKPDTDDMRDAPALTVIKHLTEKGATIRAYDPIAAENAKHILRENKNVHFSDTIKSVLQDTDAVIVMTEWNEFKDMDLSEIKSLMKTPVMIDARNVYEPTLAAEHGFTYVGVGR
jgi:UDPglucose 6-dehydrogenase